MSSKVTALDGNRKPMYDFLLVINSNLGPISHPFWDTATYWLKIANSSHTLLFSALAGVTAFEFVEKFDGSWNYRVFQAADGEDLATLVCTVFDWSTRVTDERTDGRTDGQYCDS